MCLGNVKEKDCVARLDQTDVPMPCWHFPHDWLAVSGKASSLTGRHVGLGRHTPFPLFFRSSTISIVPVRSHNRDPPTRYLFFTPVPLRKRLKQFCNFSSRPCKDLSVLIGFGNFLDGHLLGFDSRVQSSCLL